MIKKVIAFAASSSRRSINKQLVTHACGLLRGAECEILDLNDYELPLFSVDRERELGHPGLARAFLQKITDSDGLIISFAEHNGAYSAAYKSLYDWVSRIEPQVYQGKPMVLLSTSPGKRGGLSVMELAQRQIPRYGGDIRASFSLPSFAQNFDTDGGRISDAGYAEQLEAAVNRLFE